MVQYLRSQADAKLSEIQNLSQMLGNKDISVDIISKRFENIFNQRDKAEKNQWTKEDNTFLYNYLTEGVKEKEKVKESIWSKINPMNLFSFKDKDGNIKQAARVLEVGDNEKYQTMAKIADMYRGEIKDLTIDQQMNFLEEKYENSAIFGKNYVLNTKGLEDLRQKIKSKHDDDYRKTLMLAAFGNDEEIGNARTKLKNAGLNNWDDIVNRKNRIDAYFLTKKDYSKADLRKEYNPLMFMTPEDFNATIEQRLRQEKGSKYNAVVEKLGSSDVLGGISDLVNEFKKINRRINKNARVIQDLQNQPDLVGHLYDFRRIISEDFEKNEFNDPNNLTGEEEKADENRNRLLKNFFVWTNGLGFPQMDIFKKWWNKYGKEKATNSKKKNIFSIEGNLDESMYDENERLVYDLDHHYLKFIEANMHNYPVLRDEPYKLPVGINTAASENRNRLMVRNEFEIKEPKIYEQNRVDNIKMGIIEEPLFNEPVKTDAVLSAIPKEELPKLTIGSTHKLATAARHPNNNPEALRQFGRAVLDNDKAHRAKVRDFISEGLKDYNNSMSVNEELLSYPMYTSNINDDILKRYEEMKLINEDTAKNFAGSIMNDILNEYGA